MRLPLGSMPARLHLWLLSPLSFAALIACEPARNQGAEPEAIFSTAEVQAADMVFTGGAVYTATGEDASAVAVRDGEIVYVGDDVGVRELMGPHTREVAIGDGLLAPGFIDAHVHPVGVGVALTAYCDVSGIGERSRILAKIETCIAERRGEAWLVGRGWALGAFPESRPSAADLDAILPEGMAAYLTAEDGHNAWASSAAFARAGVDATTEDPEGGHIERLADGSPQGTLRERAMGLLTEHLPKLTDADQEAALVAALARFNGYGITTVVSAGVDATRVAQYQRVLERGDLSARSVLALWVGPDWNEDFDTVSSLFSDEGQHLRVTQIKLMLDGVMENQTAHVSFAYGEHGHHGTQFFEDEARLADWATRFEALGYQLHFHTVGDEAISQGIRILTVSREARQAPNIRPVFAHDYLVSEEDYEALREAGAYMQLTMLWDQQNDSMVNLNRPYLTDAQYADLMPAEQLLAAGLPVIGGSDAPVGQANPLASIQVAVTGQGVPYFDGGDMLEQPPMPGGRTELEPLLRAYTIEAARALAIDEFTGSLAVGKRADLVLLQRNLFTVPVDSIYGTKVAMTLMDGQVVYEAPKP